MCRREYERNRESYGEHNNLYVSVCLYSYSPSVHQDAGSLHIVFSDAFPVRQSQRVLCGLLRHTVLLLCGREGLWRNTFTHNPRMTIITLVIQQDYSTYTALILKVIYVLSFL